jgi:hypothetical protein
LDQLTSAGFQQVIRRNHQKNARQRANAGRTKGRFDMSQIAKQARKRNRQSSQSKPEATTQVRSAEKAFNLREEIREVLLERANTIPPDKQSKWVRDIVARLRRAA